VTAWSEAKPIGRTALFYTLKIKQFHKTVPDGLAQNLPTEEEEHHFSCFRLRDVSARQLFLYFFKTDLLSWLWVLLLFHQLIKIIKNKFDVFVLILKFLFDDLNIKP